MKRADAVLGYVAAAVEDFPHVVPYLVAVWQTGRCPNVAGGHDSFVFDNYAAASSAVTRCAFSHRFAQVQEILIPVGSRMIILQEPSPSSSFREISSEQTNKLSQYKLLFLVDVDFSANLMPLVNLNQRG